MASVLSIFNLSLFKRFDPFVSVVDILRNFCFDGPCGTWCRLQKWMFVFYREVEDHLYSEYRVEFIGRNPVVPLLVFVLSSIVGRPLVLGTNDLIGIIIILI